MHEVDQTWRDSDEVDEVDQTWRDSDEVDEVKQEVASRDTMTRSETIMWANAQRDGRPAEHRWRPLFNAAVWLAPTARMPCSNEAKTRNPSKFAWVPQTNRADLSR